MILAVRNAGARGKAFGALACRRGALFRDQSGSLGGIGRQYAGGDFAIGKIQSSGRIGFIVECQGILYKVIVLLRFKIAHSPNISSGVHRHFIRIVPADKAVSENLGLYKIVQREYNFHTSIPMRSAQEGPGRQRIWITLRIHQKNQQQIKG